MKKNVLTTTVNQIHADTFQEERAA